MNPRRKEKMSKRLPTVVVSVRSGIVEQVKADQPCKIIILDYDTVADGHDENRFILFNNELVFLNEFDITEEDADPDLITKIARLRKTSDSGDND
ncbi:MAG: hypothetical protein QW835_07620 [Candidatus Hadarchaeum sp.]